MDNEGENGSDANGDDDGEDGGGGEDDEIDEWRCWYDGGWSIDLVCVIWCSI